MNTYTQRGLSFIELVIIAAVIGVLSALIYPTYKDSVRRADRLEAQAYLMELSHKLASYRLVNQNFKNLTMNDIGEAVFPDAARQTYQISITDADGKSLTDASANIATYLLTATPRGAQEGNGLITLNQANNECWYKDDDEGKGECLAWSAK